MAASVPDDLRYTKDHEWARRAGGRWTVGITAHAQSHLGDVVYVDLPAVGRILRAGEAAAAVESVKAAADVFAPAAGTIVEANAALAENPDRVNADPYGAGWFFVLEVSGDVEAAWASLLDAAAYRRHIAE